MQLKVLSSDDWELWRTARLRALADSPEAFGATLAQWQSAEEDRWRERLSSVPFNVVALVDHDAVGQASGSEPDGAHGVELISMWVSPSVRGTGVADALVAAVTDYAVRVGASTLKLSVRSFNERAIHMYQRMGFEFAREPADEVAEVAMRRSL